MDRFEIGNLRSYYGSLLTDKQNELLRLHYDEDISFGELSELLNISRQAVLDSIKRGEKALLEFENLLKLSENYNKISVLADDALLSLENGDNDKVKTLIKAIKQVAEE